MAASIRASPRPEKWADIAKKPALRQCEIARETFFRTRNRPAGHVIATISMLAAPNCTLSPAFLPIKVRASGET